MSHLLTLAEAINLSRDETRKLYQQYVNPGMANQIALLNLDRKYVRAEGVQVWDEDGVEYLDFFAGVGSVNLGHNHPGVLAALDALRERPKILHATLSPFMAALAHNLAELLPGDLSRTFFCNSGTEAVEGALKLAKALTRRSRLLSTEGSFHGKSVGALSVTGREKYRQPFLPLIPGTTFLPYGELAPLENALQEGDVAAFIVEPIQGEGGIIVPPAGYLKKAQELCHHYGALFIADEVQTGLGRTGTLFACETEQLVPDIICLAKSLGGGVMPVGAFVTRPALWDRVYGGIGRSQLHTSTFSGNALAMAAGIASLEIMQSEELADQAREKGEYFLNQLRQLQERHPIIQAVRGRGLLIGVEFKPPARQGVAGGRWLNAMAKEYFAGLVVAELLNRHHIITIYTLNNPNVIRLEPPLTVSTRQIDRVVEALEQIFRENRTMLGVTLRGARHALRSILPPRRAP